MQQEYPSMSIELAIREAVAQAFQIEVMPLLQPVLEQMKFVNIPRNETTAELWDTREVAKYLKLAPITVELWRTEGRGPSFCRINGRVRYKKSDVMAFAETNKGLIGRKGRPPQTLVNQVKRTGLVVDGGHSVAGRERRKAARKAEVA
jgi:hypothetical protein